MAMLQSDVDSSAGPPDDNERFAEYLRPSVEEAVRLSVRDDPKVLGDALYPAIGPAIRHAVASAFNDVVQALSRILNKAFSIDGLVWRWESFRTGRPLGEVAYYHSLLYAVRQVLLIHRKTGLLLAHAESEATIALDREQVSGMLTAIQDFVKDSFQISDGTALQALRLGELTVLVEQGPEALLAAIIRGQPPPELRYTLRDVLERVHQRAGRELLLFEGDNRPFASCEQILRSCLMSEMRCPRKPSSVPALVFLGTIAIFILAWVAFSIYMHHRWNAALAAIESRPGLIVTHSHWGWTHCLVEGLRDPQAEAPEAVLRSESISPSHVTGEWKPYISLDPEMVLAHARRELAPPEGVDLTLAGDVLEVSGNVPTSWVDKNREAALRVPGIREIRLEGWQEWKAMIEAQRLDFTQGSSQLNKDELAAVGRLAGWIRAVLAAAPVRVEITGHADHSGFETNNARLSLERAENVMRALTAQGIPANRLDTIGAGAGGVGRAVSFRVTGSGEGTGSGS